MGTFVAILAGTIAGPLLMGIDTQWPVWISAAAMLTAIVGYLASRKIPDCEAADPELKINWNFISETFRNICFINENRVVLNSVLGISWFWFFGATLLVQIPSYSETVLGGDEQLMSTLLGMFIVGISAGSLFCERLSGGQVEIGLVPLGAMGLTLFGFDLYLASPATPTTYSSVIAFFAVGANWRITIDLMMIGIFSGFYIVPLYALVQQRTDPAHRSRVIAGNNILNALFMVVSAITAMLLLGNLFARGDGVRRSFRKALKWYKAAVAQAPNDANIVNEIAWNLTVTHFDGLRHPKYALTLMNHTMADNEKARANPAFMDTWAAAYAATGDFVNATAMQKKAIAAAQEQQQNKDLEVLTQHLEAFQRGEVVIDPVP